MKPINVCPNRRCLVQGHCLHQPCCVPAVFWFAGYDFNKRWQPFCCNWHHILMIISREAIIRKCQLFFTCFIQEYMLHQFHQNCSQWNRFLLNNFFLILKNFKENIWYFIVGLTKLWCNSIWHMVRKKLFCFLPNIKHQCSCNWQCQSSAHLIWHLLRTHCSLAPSLLRFCCGTHTHQVYATSLCEQSTY